MAKDKKPIKLRKRDILIYAVIVAVVFLTVVIAAEVVEHLPSNRAKNNAADGTPATEAVEPADSADDADAAVTTEDTRIPETQPATDSVTEPTTTATEATTPTTVPATEPTAPPATEAPKTTEKPKTEKVTTEPEAEDIEETEETENVSELEMPEDNGQPENALTEDEIPDSYTATGYNNNIKNIVLIGVDEKQLGVHDAYRTGGQSDVILILSMNLKTKEYFIVTVNRDLSVPVENYARDGGSYGWVDEQIALAYAYGDGGRSSGKNVLKSLNMLFGNDLNFLGYIAAPIPIVSTVADKVGGVEVYIEDDFSGVDDTLKMGTTVNLTGIHAENFVRSRMNMKYSNKNSLRMNRQMTFMQAFINKAKTEMSAQQLVDLYSDILDMVMTDMGKGDITKWIMTAYDYQFTGFYKVEGLEGERKNNARCTYIVPEEVQTVRDLYYKK